MLENVYAATELNKWIELVEKRLPDTAVFIQSCGRSLMVQEVYPYANAFVGFRGLYSANERGFVLVHPHQISLSCLPRIYESGGEGDRKGMDETEEAWGKVLPFAGG
jgi:hypothetical protein